MYFRRLEMQGFKSFAEKTVLEFGDGITAVVGPNGSGKSNISDAIRWVLGEQSPKSLRGGKMEDVIFSGTENRKPVGYAEVSIVMDNSDGTLNIEYETVKVTRRLYRSGDSDYLINGQNCRLKDINLLFADTGIGRDGYSIIGQGKVDEILSSKSEDRRGIFEEASGIMKYRMRMEESQRKLALAEQNLVRINDIVSELELQISTLTRQAATAQKYLDFKKELQGIEVGVLTDGIQKAEAKLAEIKENYDAIQAEIQDNETAVEKIKNDNAEKTEKSEKLAIEYNAAKDNAYAAETECTRIQSDMAITNQSIGNAQNELQRMEAEVKEKLGAGEARQKELKELKEAKLQLIKDLDVLKRDIDAEQRKLDIIIKAISGDSAQASEKNRTLIDTKLENGRYISLQDSLKTQTEIYKKRIEEINFEMELHSGEGDTARNKVTEVTNSIAGKKKDKEGIETKLNASLKTQRDLETAGEQNEARLRDANTAIDTADAQLKLLREMEENFEGYARSVKEILTLCRENKEFGSGICGAVAQIITVGKDEELAIETALGNTFQDIVTESEEEAKQAIEYLKQNRLGRATFLPLTAVTPKVMDSESMMKLKRTRGFVGIASQLVTYDSKYECIVQSLLGKVAVFEDIDAAIYAAKQNKYSFMCVTLEGDILRTSGAITGGSPEKGRRGGALSRTREIPEFEKKLSESKKRKETLIKESESLKKQLTDEQSESSKLSAQLKTAEVELATLDAELKAANLALEGVAKREAGLKTDLARQNESLTLAESKITEAKLKSEACEKLIASLEDEILKLSENGRMLDDEKERHQNAITGLKIKQTDGNARLTQANNDISRISGEIEAGLAYTENAEKRGTELKEQIAAFETKNRESDRKLKEEQERKNEFREKSNRLYEEKRSTDEELKESFEKINDITTKTGFLREESGRLEARRMRHENDSEYNKKRLWEEYELTFTKALEITGGEVPENLEECKKHISELRNSIKRLGNVNVAAIEELTETKTRYEFLVDQRKDVNESRDKLVKIISELETVMKKQFKEQFAVIRENFKAVFTELFGGGKADIVLADEANVLNCGIEINAQPPGKKLQNMMLLSGGERALTAIALLFGILRMRPTPFCMLDEIESALDDANVYRFAGYTKTLSANTQLILITHRKGTMESADSLYGVTMEEKGVSKVLSVKV